MGGSDDDDDAALLETGFGLGHLPGPHGLPKFVNT
jgi:hypothetical protein